MKKKVTFFVTAFLIAGLASIVIFTNLDAISLCNCFESQTVINSCYDSCSTREGCF